jgi:hypothetical protein
MKERLPLVLSASALLVALLGTTPLGQAAGTVIAKGVPYATKAGFATNAGKLNGHISSARPRAGQIPVLNTLGKLPASIGAVGPQGPAGVPGAKGDAGPAGPPGASGYQQIVKDNVRINGGDKNGGDDVSCPSGKSVLSGGFLASSSLLSQGTDFVLRESEPISNQTWRFRWYHPTGSGGDVTLRVICATVTS